MALLQNAVIALILVAIAVLACPGESRAEERVIGRLIRVRAPVELYKCALKTTIEAEKGDAVAEGDILSTGATGLAAMVFPDGSQIILQRSSEALIRRRDLVIATEGQIFAEMRGDRLLIIDSAAGEVITKDSHAQALITINREDGNTHVSVFSGSVILADTMGKTTIPALKKGIISKLVTPHGAGDIAEKELEKALEWADFDAPSIVVLVQQSPLGEAQQGASASEALERTLALGHLLVVTNESINGYGELHIQELARKAGQGDIKAMRELADKLEVDLIMTGEVKTALLGEVGQGIVSCGAHGTLKVYEAKSGKLLLTREGNSTSIQRSPALAGADAVEKLIATFTGTIAWDIMQGLMESLPPVQELCHIDLEVLDCQGKDRKTVTDRLKLIHEIRKATAGAVAKGKLPVALYSAGSAKTLAGLLERPEIGIFKVVAVKGDRITVKLVKKKKES